MNITIMYAEIISRFSSVSRVLSPYTLILLSLIKLKNFTDRFSFLKILRKSFNPALVASTSNS
jgi:hypothetical protein